MDPMLRPVTQADLPAVLALNESEVPHVGRIPLERLAWFQEHAALFLVAESPAHDGPASCALGDARSIAPAGFIIALTPDAPYTSPNFLWFRERYPSFLYVDRIAVAAPWRRQGLGRALYESTAEHARALGLPWVTCEVNLVPPNPESIDFHLRIGFERAGTRASAEAGPLVQMMRRQVGVRAG